MFEEYNISRHFPNMLTTLATSQLSGWQHISQLSKIYFSNKESSCFELFALVPTGIE